MLNVGRAHSCHMEDSLFNIFENQKPASQYEAFLEIIKNTNWTPTTRCPSPILFARACKINPSIALEFMLRGWRGNKKRVQKTLRRERKQCEELEDKKGLQNLLRISCVTRRMCRKILRTKISTENDAFNQSLHMACFIAQQCSSHVPKNDFFSKSSSLNPFSAFIDRQMLSKDLKINRVFVMLPRTKATKIGEGTYKNHYLALNVNVLTNKVSFIVQTILKPQEKEFAIEALEILPGLGKKENGFPEVFLYGYYHLKKDKTKRSFILQEYFSKKDLMRQVHKLDLPTCISYAKQIAQNIQFIHANNCIHADVKLENCLSNEKKQACLADFDTLCKKGMPILFRTLLYGSFETTSPDLLSKNKKHIEQADDMYAFGVCLYILAFKRYPRSAKSTHLLGETISTNFQHAPMKAFQDESVKTKIADIIKQQKKGYRGVLKKAETTKSLQEKGFFTIIAQLLHPNPSDRLKAGPCYEALCELEISMASEASI